MQQDRLRQLQSRFIAVNMRSRALRLSRASRAGALDLARLADARPEAWDALQRRLGAGPGAEISLVDAAPPPGPEQALASDLAGLAAAAREDEVETGARDLAVGWPLLEGRAPDGTWLRAPLLLYPASLQTTSTGRARWTLTLEEGAPELNVSLVHALRRLVRTRLDLEALLQADEDGALKLDDGTWRDLHAALDALGLRVGQGGDALPPLAPLPERRAEDRDALPLDAFALHHTAVLGRFPRSGSSLVLDYDELLRLDAAGDLGGLATDILAVDEAAPWQEEPPLEDRPPASATAAPPDDSRRWQLLPSDSSQDAVFKFLDDAPGRGLVVQGPPGTGKSQLIVNLVSAAIARGQRVLLVCQKRAALDVVAARLAAAGLGEPVAVVHDAQRDRAAVCRAIADTRERPHDADATAAQEHAAAHDRLQARLDASQDAFRRLTRARGVPPLAALQEAAADDPQHPLPDLTPFAASTQEADALAALPRLDALALDAEHLAYPPPPALRTPWERHTPQDLQRCAQHLHALRDTLHAMQRAPGHLTPAQAAEHAALWQEADPTLALLRGDDPKALDDLLLFWAWTDGEAQHGEWAQVMARLRRAEEELRFAPRDLITTPRATLDAWIADLDRWKQLAARWYRFALPDFWRLRKLPGQLLDRCGDLPRASGLVDPQALCRDAIAWQDLIHDLPADNPVLSFGLQGHPDEIRAAVQALTAQHAQVRAIHRLTERLAPLRGPYATPPSLEPWTEPRRDPFVAAALADAAQAQRTLQARDILHALASSFTPEALQPLRAHIDHGRLDDALAWVHSTLDAWQDHPRAAHLDRATQHDPPWLRAFLRAWRRHPTLQRTPAQDATTALHRAWLQHALQGQHPRVIDAPLTRPEPLQALRDALAARRACAARGIHAAFHLRLRDAAQDKKRGRDLRRLAADAKRQRNRLSLRQLVEAYWARGLPLARPAWFCSPESVASLFPLQHDLFDLVIFDEASQCPVESALPTLARAQRAVIAGDDQQMPPSHFFQAAPDDPDDDDETSAILASRSLLDLARVAFPDTTLRWHYRSRHEDLIAFSNAAFYGGRLITAPHRDAPRRDRGEGLRWHPVPGLWTDQRNEAEADAVIHHLASLLALTPHPPSLGVVTFNQRQAELITERLRLRTFNDPAFNDLLALDRQRPLTEQLFIRNLENVQGDERDIILFSIGYGPREPHGRIAARFGPLGLEGGEKRLNVAITRARLGVHVFASFEPDALQVEHTRHPGPRLLRAWLRFVHAAEHGLPRQPLLDEARALGGGRGVTGAHRAQPAAPRLGDATADRLALRLRAQGLRVQRGLGLGSQRLDLAVGPPDDDAWTFGVTCADLLHTEDPLARDVYTPLFWERLGWRVVRYTPGMWPETPPAA